MTTNDIYGEEVQCDVSDTKAVDLKKKHFQSHGFDISKARNYTFIDTEWLNIKPQLPEYTQTEKNNKPTTYSP